MTVRNTPEVTSNSTPSVHAGLNAAVVAHTFAGTISASSRVNMLALQGGMRVIDGYVSVPASSPGAGALVSVQDGQGNTYLQSASANSGAVMRFDAAGNANLGERITGSANLFVQLNGFAGATGTAALQVSLTVTYLADLDGD